MTEGARTLSDDEKAKMQREGELLSRRLQRGNDDLNEELNAAQGEIVDGIGRKMLEVLDRYSRENGFTAVLDTSAQGSPVVYGSSHSDITQDIVRLYDQAYPIKGGRRPRQLRNRRHLLRHRRRSRLRKAIVLSGYTILVRRGGQGWVFSDSYPDESYPCGI